MELQEWSIKIIFKKEYNVDFKELEGMPLPIVAHFLAELDNKHSRGILDREMQMQSMMMR